MSRQIHWDQKLINRYNVSGPRYTSYPTALEFSPTVNNQSYLKALQDLPKSNHLSLYVHIPFCWHVCYYCACNKVVTRDYDRVSPYLDALLKEIETVSSQLKGQTVTQVHFGGGTPTFLNRDDLNSLMNQLRHAFNFADNQELECSIEIDPRTVTVDDLKHLKTLGFNRLSLGVQDFDSSVQKAVNRVQSEHEIEQLMTAARELKFDSISFDLIYGLPKQTVTSFNATLDKVIQLQPDRLSVFNYAHLPHRFKPQRRIKAEELPGSDDKLNILHNTIDRMQSAGYVYIGMDHFALPTDELAIAQSKGELHRNFQGYTTQKHCDLIGLGVSAISSLQANEQSAGIYSQNARELTDYMQQVKHSGLAVWRGAHLSRDDQIRKSIIFELICNFSLDITASQEHWGINFRDYFVSSIEALNRLEDDGMIVMSESNISITDRGRLFVRNVCMAFDSYFFGGRFGENLLHSSSGVTNAYSKAI
ncbi:MAG: oxygen-independent coproporphyrinogen III oxidase [Gammaproteobacteria bacterium]|nr:oxygen-independent coproporphyrinogen III oxidase [Gammaproteobacteria bacterium]